MAAESKIDYEALAQNAMRGVVREVLMQAAKSGHLPGNHHFYISFDTAASGVVLSKRLKEKYPHEMTIVLQHRFWDLTVTEDGFGVKLTFDGIPEHLVVPFAAIRVFFDPSVRYGFQFEDTEGDSSESAETGGTQRFRSRSDRANGAPETPLRSTAPKKPRVPRKPKVDKTKTAKSSEKPAQSPANSTSSQTPTPSQPAKLSVTPKVAEDKPAVQPEGGGAQIVSLDAFRKK